MKISMTPERAGAALLALAQKKTSRKERTLSDPESKLVELYAQHGDKSDDFTGPLLEAVELLLGNSTFEDYYRTKNNTDYPIAEDFIEKNANAGNLGPEHLLKVIAMAASVSDKHVYHMKGGGDFVRRLIELGAPVNGVDSDGKSPLYFACRFGGPKIFAALVEAGADTEVTCEDILPAPGTDGMTPIPRCNLLKLALDGKYLGSKHHWAYEGQDSVYFESMRWDHIITTLLSQGRSFDPGHPMIAHHLQIACSMGRMDLINIILRPEDAAYQASLAEIPMVQGLTLPAALVSAARAGRSAIVEMLLSLGADPLTPFPLESVIPAPFEWKQLFNRQALPPLAPLHALFSHFPHFHGGYKWDDISKCLEHIIIAGARQPVDAVFEEDCGKLLQGFIAHGCVLAAGRLLDRGFRPFPITFCESPAALDLCVQYGISSLVDWQTVLSHACHENKTEVFRAVVKNAGPGLWKDHDDMMECARRVIGKPELIRCFIDHCGLDIDYVGEQEAFREFPLSSLLSYAIENIHSKMTTPTIQMLISLGANTDMPGLPFNAKEALWNATKGRDRFGVSPVEGFRENILPAIRAICGDDMPYPPGWPHVEENQHEEIRPAPLSTDHPTFLNVSGYDSSMSNLMSSDSEMPDVEQCDNTRLPEIPSLTSEREAFRGLDGGPYHFVSLGGFSNGIRLLQLEPATTFEAPIQSSFIRCSLAEAPNFQVLTGCWGATKAVELIGIDDGLATVAVELAAALRRVRSSSTPVMLWSRGLCINHQDIDEANKQMALVRDVHLSAQRLLVWLGEATDGANLVFDFLDKNVFNPPDEHAVNPGNRFDVLLQGASMRRPCDMSLSNPMDEYDGSTPLGYRQNTSGLFYPADVGAAYEQLCLRPWFYMPWTETEIFLCDQMTLLCGPYKITSGLSENDKLNILKAMDGPYMYNPMAKARTPNERPVVCTGPRHLYELSLCRTRLERCSDPVTCAETIASRLAWGPCTRSDPRESVFAIAALSSTALFVMDYRDSIAVLLRKVTETALNSQLKVLLHYGFNNKVVQGLPSWVPDLTHPEDMNVLYEPFSFGMKTGPHIQYKAPRVEGDNMILQGFCIEKIHAVGVVMQDHDPLVLHDWENVAASMPRTSVIESITKAFMHTLVASTGSGRHVRVETFRRWYTIHGSGELRVADAEWFEACELAEAWSGPSDQRQLRNNMYRMKQYHDDLERYERGVWAMGRGRRFFVTDRGNMGLGPGGAAVGDVVMQPLTLTITQPFSYVLTPREDGLYGFRGASCLYTADAIPRFEKKEVIPMDFVIR